jgi:hypothetical protein
MTDPTQGHGGPEELRRALEAADAMISRIEDLVADHLSRGAALDEKAAFYEVVEALEIAPEITTIRLALGDSPSRFGEPTPLSAGDHTG